MLDPSCHGLQNKVYLCTPFSTLSVEVLGPTSLSCGTSESTCLPFVPAAVTDVFVLKIMCLEVYSYRKLVNLLLHLVALAKSKGSVSSHSGTFRM